MKNLLSFFYLLVLPVFAVAQDTSVDLDAARQLSAILEQTRTLQADVDVLTLDQDGREIQESSARLVMQKPDHIYWEILTPYTELIVTNGLRIWRFEPDLDQVTVDAFNNDISRTPVLLLNGNAEDVAASYTVSSADMDYGSRTRFILQPKSPDNLYERFSLTFAGNDLEEMQFEDSLGQKISLIFSGMVVNADIDPGTFVFHMPEGVEVIDNTR